MLAPAAMQRPGLVAGLAPPGLLPTPIASINTFRFANSRSCAAARARAAAVVAAASTAADTKRGAKPAAKAAGGTASVWPCRGGQLVRVVQRSDADEHSVEISVRGGPTPAPAQPELHW